MSLYGIESCPFKRNFKLAGYVLTLELNISSVRSKQGQGGHNRDDQNDDERFRKRNAPL